MFRMGLASSKLYEKRRNPALIKTILIRARRSSFNFISENRPPSIKMPRSFFGAFYGLHIYQLLTQQLAVSQEQVTPFVPESLVVNLTSPVSPLKSVGATTPEPA